MNLCFAPLQYLELGAVSIFIVLENILCDVLRGGIGIFPMLHSAVKFRQNYINPFAIN